MSNDLTQELQQQVASAYTEGKALSIRGSNSKTFLGNKCEAAPLMVSEHSGIVSYEPVELVITARAGTKLKEIEDTLAAEGQMLPFEPPYFGEDATLGGCIACGLAGPSRPFAGSVRDYVLGVKLINGKAEVLRFGGQVMKNVAGYDCSRLMAGAMGTLGLMLEISLKVLPKPAQKLTLVKQLSVEKALNAMTRWSGKPYPLSAAAFDGEKLYMRLSGSETAVESSSKLIGGDRLDSNNSFWQQLKEHKLPFFDSNKSLWRLSIPATTPALDLAGKTFIDWSGAQRWLISDEPADKIRDQVKKLDGHATLFRNNDNVTTFQKPDAGLMEIHRRLKTSFDPKGIFNPGRLYSEI